MTGVHPRNQRWRLGSTTRDVFGVHCDEVVYNDGDHCKNTKSIGEGVQGVMGDHGDCAKSTQCLENEKVSLTSQRVWMLVLS
jgi:hypothetical protein